MVESGEIEIFRVRDDGQEEHITTVKPGNYFGELGPMLKLPRSASARALSDANLTGYGVRMFRGLRPGRQPSGD